MEHVPSRIQGKCIVIGDVHGQAEHLVDLLKRLHEEVEDFSQRWIVFVGDFIDRGPRPKKVLDIVLYLRQRHGKVTACMGNHEHMLGMALGWFPLPPPQKPPKKSSWFQDDDWPGPRDFRPSESYCRGYSSRSTFLGYGAPLWETQVLKRRIPLEHRDFLQNLPWLVEHPDYFIVHAGLVRTMDMDRQIKALRAKEAHCLAPAWLHDHSLSWLGPPDDCPKTVVSGHVRQDDVVFRDRRILLDTTGGLGGRLSAVLLPEETVIQSRDIPYF